MPKIVDEAERKARIAKTVWEIAAEHGLHAATMRAVAAQCELSVGAIQHSFASQARLQRHAMALLVEQAKTRIEVVAQTDSNGMIDESVECASDAGNRATAARAIISSDQPEHVVLLLEQLLPLDKERRQEARAWAMFSNEALFDDDLRAYATEMNGLMEQFCRSCLEHLNECGLVRRDADLLVEASALQALLDGLTLRLLADPTPGTAAIARQTLRRYLQRLQ